MQGNGLLIGEVAAQSGLSRKALRLYEARGILLPPRREPSGYRRYPGDVLPLLSFVGQARRLGLTLSEIKHIVGLRRSGSAPCVHVRALLEQKAADLEGMLAGRAPHPRLVALDERPPRRRLSAHRSEGR